MGATVLSPSGRPSARLTPLEKEKKYKCTFHTFSIGIWLDLQKYKTHSWLSNITQFIYLRISLHKILIS